MHSPQSILILLMDCFHRYDKWRTKVHAECELKHFSLTKIVDDLQMSKLRL